MEAVPSLEDFFDIEKLSPLIKEYERLISALREQIDYYKIEHEGIRAQTNNLIIENNTLSEKLKSSEKEIIKHDGSKTNIVNATITNLQDQISCLLQERNSVMTLWQQAQKEIDSLEGQLRTGVTETNQCTEEKDKEVQSCLEQINVLKNELKQQIEVFNDEKESLTDRLDRNTCELEISLANHRKALDQIDECEKQITDLESKVDDLTFGRNELQEAVTKSQQYIKVLEQQDQKNNRIIEELTYFKENSVYKEEKYKDEICQLQTALTDVIEEAGVKVKTEVESLNREFTNKMKLILEDMHEIQIQYKEKNTEFDKLVARCQMLEEELANYKNGKTMHEYESKILVLGEKLDATIHKLVASERKNSQLISECDSLKYDMNAMSRAFERDIQVRELESKNLERRLFVMQEELISINKNFVQTVSECQVLTEHVTVLERELKRRRENDELFQRIWEEYNNTENCKEDKAKILEDHIKSHVELNHRWKEELQRIIGRFRKHIKQLTAENKSLLNDNERMRNELVTSKQEIARYLKEIKTLSKR